MKKSKIIQNDYLDILFDGRNKSYGGYALRKSANGRYAKSMAVLLGLCVSIITYSVIGKAPVDNNDDAIKKQEVILTNVPETPPRPKPPVEVATPKPKPELKVTTKKFTKPKIEEDEKVMEDEKPPEQSELKNAVVGNKNIEGDSIAITDYIVEEGNGSGVVGVKEDMEPKSFVEQMPESLYDLNAYLAKHLNYPREAKENNIEGRVIVQFVVNETGIISNANIMGDRVLGGGLEEEAIRVVSTMPKWKAGKQNGTAVKVYFTLPISFRLE